MPEGDTIARLAKTVGAALAGKTLVRVESPLGSVARAKLEGHTVVAVEPLGKNLLVRFDDGRVLHTHLRMNGAWHVYAPGQRWRRPGWQARVVLETADAVCVCFHAPIVRLLRSDRGDRLLAHVGPDVLAPDFDPQEARRRLRALPPETTLAEALLTQRALAGIGNVYKSEALFLEKLDPFARLDVIDDTALDALVVRARALMQRNLGPGARRTRATASPVGPRRLWVYDRSGEPCLRCGERVAMKRTRDGRSTYYCVRCQRVA